MHQVDAKSMYPQISLRYLTPAGQGQSHVLKSCAVTLEMFISLPLCDYKLVDMAKDLLGVQPSHCPFE